MKIQFDNPAISRPQISLVLLDWSCRESFHVFNYLSKQSIPRDQYEVIWIEYYGRRSPEIQGKIEEAERDGEHPPVDRWIVMEMPQTTYYHKHLMYNLGIASSRGKIVTLCDSDVLLRPTFVESIIKSFDECSDAGIVLHLDEVRNIEKKYYPFNHPTVEQLIQGECINWRDGKTLGLLDEDDPMHTLNYGACMCALREDLIEIGGADEHIDYLGHICGPYELTFRLKNLGRREDWHQSEFLYHTWHPGTDGAKNYLGPHDGKNVSTTALKAKYDGRVMPLVENPLIRLLRQGEEEEFSEAFLSQAIDPANLENWSSEYLTLKEPIFSAKISSLNLVLSQFFRRALHFLRKKKTLKGLFRGIFISSFLYLRDIVQRSNRDLKKCEQCFKALQKQGVKEVAVLGMEGMAETFFALSIGGTPSIKAVFDSRGFTSFHGIPVYPVKDAKNYDGKIIITALDKVDAQIEALKAEGVETAQIVVPW